jgi:hypothetical protein
MTTRVALASCSMLAVWVTTAGAEWLPVGLPLGFGYRPTACPDGAGGAYVIWTVAGSTAEDVYLQRVTAAGTIAPGWPAGGLPVCVLPNSQLSGAPVPDGFGGVFVAWQDFRDSPTRPDIYAQRIMADGTIAPGWPVNGAPVTRAPDYQQSPRIAPDGEGGAFLSWDDFSPARDLYAQHLTEAGQVAGGWPADGLPICTADGAQGYASLIPDGTGGLLIAWSDSRAAGLGVYAQRITASGATATGWVANGLPIVLGKGIPQLVPVGAGEVLVACLTGDQYGFDLEYYVQRFTFAGTIAPGWPAAGVRVCSAPGERAGLVATSDDRGGMLLSWYDYRDPNSGGDIYALRVLADGSSAAGWAANGLRVSSLTNYEYSGIIAPDGTGGGYITWGLDFGGGSRFLVQHLMANGGVAPGWPTNGTFVGTSLSQFDPWITSDGRGGAIVAWEERLRSSIYAQRFVSDGIVPVLLALVRAEVEADHVNLTWHGAEAAGLGATVYRRTDRSDWQIMGTVTGDGTGILRFEDRAVSPGERYAYRLGYSDGGAERFTTEAWVDVPALQLALEGPRPNPAVGALNVWFTLPNAAPATLELMDLSGRRLNAREVGALGAGRHVVRLDQGVPVPPGMYWVTLRQNARTVLARAAVIR